MPASCRNHRARRRLRQPVGVTEGGGEGEGALARCPWIGYALRRHRHLATPRPLGRGASDARNGPSRPLAGSRFGVETGVCGKRSSSCRKGVLAMTRSLLIITMVIAFAASQSALVACNNEDSRQTYEAAALADYAVSLINKYQLGGIDGSALGSDLTPDARAAAESIGRNAANSAFDAAMEAIAGEFEYAVVVDAAARSFSEYLIENAGLILINETQLAFAIYIASERTAQLKSEAAERAGNAVVAAVDAAIDAEDIE